jgi:hypothetical protein
MLHLIRVNFITEIENILPDTTPPPGWNADAADTRFSIASVNKVSA